ncbi:MAG: valine--tRNA ligase, partial [Lachnospiraceae bacterium]|nr:valine--tRNA ligase [Lachnospiraceae bacterium]
KREYGGRITRQLRRMGASCDWNRERFTMDEGCSKAVREVFVRLYEKGLIYQGNRLINWCPVCKTSISDAEVQYEEQAGHFWHIKYPLIEDDGSISKTRFLEFATTRPETMLGDTAVAVNPQDDRYKDVVGKFVWLPFVDRKIPIIADPYVETDFGTGVVKITPAHDPNDFEVGKRHNLPEINIMNDDATINENGGKFCGLDRYEARKQIVKELDEMGLLVRIEDYSHNVGTHDRCKATVEPLIKKQWFVKMDDLIKPAVKAVKEGEIKLIPERLEKTYFNWTDNIKDWCISRQLWWGHRIPAYYCGDCGEITVAKTENKPCKCPKCGSTNIEQDPDTLDTWFSSALWPFSTLGWPKMTEDLKYFYPTDVLVTGYDIIFFWVIRMIFSGYNCMGEKPFKTVLFHGLVRDSQGRKMSKSLGNGIDPLEIIDKYGADALRFTLITGNAPGNDMRFYWERVEASRNFANKVWNASRFIMMNMQQMEDAGIDYLSFEPGFDRLEDSDRWILSKLNTCIKEITQNLDAFELGVAAQKVNDFIWDDFCDWYIEMVKPRLYGDNKDSKIAAMWTLRHVLTDALKLLHPYMPFVTEEIFCTLKEAEGTLKENESIMISDWPVARDELSFETEAAAVEMIKEAVRKIRDLRTSMNVPPSRKAEVFVVSEKESVRDTFEKSRNFFASLGYASNVIIQTDRSGISNNAVSATLPDAVVYIPFEELVDIEKELQRLDKEKVRLQGEIKRCEGMLSNPNFTGKAPEAKINEEKSKLENYRSMLAKVEERYDQLR